MNELLTHKSINYVQPSDTPGDNNWQLEIFMLEKRFCITGGWKLFVAQLICCKFVVLLLHSLVSE
jgi:hypothetical protein